MVHFTDPLLRILRSTGDLFHDCLTIVDINDPRQPCLYVNRQFTVQTGYQSNDTVGKNLRFLQGPLTSPETTQIMSKAFSEKEAACVDVINYRQSQEPFLNRLVMLPLKRKQAFYYVGFQNAISEREAAKSQQTISSGDIQHNLNNLLSHVTLRVSDPNIDERLQIARELANTFERINTFCLTLTSSAATS
ncbi:MAG: hypothetical protein ACJAXW_003386 [Candidatus Azotimanducaceae bacterium]|jgi:hypothetical protein